MSKNLHIRHLRFVGRDNKHLRLTLHDGKQEWSAIAFRQGHWAEKLRPAQAIDIVYNLEFNEWNGTRSMQLNIVDLHPSEE